MIRSVINAARVQTGEEKGMTDLCDPNSGGFRIKAEVQGLS